MAYRTVKKHKAIDILFPRAVTAVADLKYTEASFCLMYQALSWRNLSHRKIILLVESSSQMGLSHLSL